jgi:uncharacterized protein YceK
MMRAKLNYTTHRISVSAAIVLPVMVFFSGCAGLNKHDQAAEEPKPVPLLGAAPEQNDPHNWHDYDGRGF